MSETGFTVSAARETNAAVNLWHSCPESAKLALKRRADKL
jgi:hypothetical protein